MTIRDFIRDLWMNTSKRKNVRSLYKVTPLFQRRGL